MLKLTFSMKLFDPLLISTILLILISSCMSEMQDFNSQNNNEEECWDLKTDTELECPQNMECWYVIDKEKYLCLDKKPWEWMCDGHFNIMDQNYPPKIECVDSQNVNYIQPHITDVSCSANRNCPDSLKCWSLNGYQKPGSWCVDSYPQGWYCDGKSYLVQESYPPTIICS